MATKTQEQMVPLAQVAARLGGIEAGRYWIKEAGGEPVEAWDGTESVPMSVAAKARRLHDERRARNEAMTKGYADYLKGRERKKQDIRQATFKKESNRLHWAQAREMRENSGKNGRPFLTAGSEFISLSPQGLREASQLANDAAEQWAKDNRELTQDEWAKKAGLG